MLYKKLLLGFKKKHSVGGTVKQLKQVTKYFKILERKNYASQMWLLLRNIN